MKPADTMEELLERWIAAGENLRADDPAIFKLMLAAVEAAARFVAPEEESAPVQVH